MPGRQLRHCGQSIIELTLFLPLLLLMIFGLVDLSLAFVTHVKIRNAVAEGGYFIAQNPDNVDGARSQIRHELRDLDPPISDAHITISGCVTSASGVERMVSVNYPYRPLFGFFGIGPELLLQNRTAVPQFGICP
jgi:hypothetical protein